MHTCTYRTMGKSSHNNSYWLCCRNQFTQVCHLWNCKGGAYLHTAHREMVIDGIFNHLEKTEKFTSAG